MLLFKGINYADMFGMTFDFGCLLNCEINYYVVMRTNITLFVCYELLTYLHSDVRDQNTLPKEPKYFM